MFEKFKDMGNLVKKAKEMKKQMEEVQNELKTMRFVGEVNDVIKVAVTGELDCVAVKVLDPKIAELIEGAMGVEKFEKAVAQAFNQASKKSKQQASSKLSDVSKGLNIPGLT